MSERIDFTLTATDGTGLRCYEWPCADARAVVVVCHGMAEHAARYGRFAGALSDAGIAALSMDLRGHGASAEGGVKGWFAEKDGWKAVLEDFRQLCLKAQERYPEAPLVLFGHSMGSIFARAALFSYGGMFRAAVLSGVTVDQPLRRNVAPAVARAVGALQGRKMPSKLLDSLTFGSYNRQFRPNRTAFDWLSRDGAEVDKYVADADCGFICTGSMFVDVARALLSTLKRKNVAKMPKDVPILILSGGEDPCGMNGRAARWLEAQYRAVGLDARARVYEKARHELLNETNRDEVTSDILAFIGAAL
jgi:alpha-beta hydrolase superfamily lysophospholipase